MRSTNMSTSTLKTTYISQNPSRWMTRGSLHTYTTTKTLLPLRQLNPIPPPRLGSGYERPSILPLPRILILTLILTLTLIPTILRTAKGMENTLIPIGTPILTSESLSRMKVRTERSWRRKDSPSSHPSLQRNMDPRVPIK